jgi:hypothetical protein
MNNEINMKGAHHEFIGKIKKMDKRLEQKLLTCIKDCTLCKLECTHHAMNNCVELCDLCIQSCNLYLSISYCTIREEIIREKIIEPLNMCLYFSKKCYEECKEHNMKSCENCANSCNYLSSFIEEHYTEKKKYSRKRKHTHKKRGIIMEGN